PPRDSPPPTHPPPSPTRPPSAPDRNGFLAIPHRLSESLRLCERIREKVVEAIGIGIIRLELERRAQLRRRALVVFLLAEHCAPATQHHPPAVHSPPNTQCRPPLL